jgi:hypothetical protein
VTQPFSFFLFGDENAPNIATIYPIRFAQSWIVKVKSRVRLLHLIKTLYLYG